jgi:hypothetical protein
MTAVAMTPEAKLRRRIVLTAKSAGWSTEGLYARASEVVGRTLAPGFGLTTCDEGELRLVLDDVRISAERRGPATERGPKTRGRARVPGVVRMASTRQLWKIESLREALHLSQDELAGIIGQATRGRTRTVRTSGDAHVTIEALLGVTERRQSQAARACQEMAERLGEARSAQGRAHDEGAQA